MADTTDAAPAGAWLKEHPYGARMRKSRAEHEMEAKQRGDAPVCAFGSDEHDFSADNWNCATVNAIRDLVSRFATTQPSGCHREYCDDQNYATIRVHDVDFEDDSYYCLWLTWYKNRGRTEAMWLMGEDGAPRKPTEQDLRLIIQFYQTQTARTWDGDAA